MLAHKAADEDFRSPNTTAEERRHAAKNHRLSVRPPVAKESCGEREIASEIARYGKTSV